ncbi:MAG: apolipoprotein N-acyltransferase, partial [Candidatus Omnitrophota bacterium]
MENKWFSLIGYRLSTEGRKPHTAHRTPALILLAVFSGVLLALAFSARNPWFLAWIGLIPLLSAIKGASRKRAFLLSYLCGIVFFAGTIYWVAWVTYAGTAALVLYLALYLGLFGLFAARFIPGRYSMVVIPALWVSLEFIRSHAFTGFGWAVLGYSQYKVLGVIQIADILGAYGVSFLIVMANVAIYEIIESRLSVIGYRLSGEHRTPHTAHRTTKHILLATSLCLIATLLYGYFRLHQQFITPAIRVSLIQGNIPQVEKWDEGYRESILEEYSLLTRLAVNDKPDIIIWPETSVPGLLNTEKDLEENLVKLAQETNTPLLVGSAMTSPLSAVHYYNSAVLISKDGEFLKQYDKLHLVPFGEFVPFEEIFPFLRFGHLEEAGAFSRGKEYVVFKIEEGKKR